MFNRHISCKPSQAHNVTSHIGIPIMIAILIKNLTDKMKLIITNFVVTQMFCILILTLRFIASKKSYPSRQISILL